MRGVVWSPTAKALVASAPADSPVKVEPASATTTAPTTTEPVARPGESGSVFGGAPGALPSGPGIAAPSTGAAPDETARVPSMEPPAAQPTSADAPMAPGSASAPIID